MDIVSSTTKIDTNTKNILNTRSNNSFEVVVIEDNQLTNTILSRALESTIKSIQSLINLPVNFLSFHNGSDYLSYLDSKDFSSSRLIVFSDYHLEDDMDGGEILKITKQKKADASVIIMSDSSNEQIWLDAVKNGAYCFLPKSNKIPVVCSELLFQMVV
jgi:DNA-binding NtrC family response regulator